MAVKITLKVICECGKEEVTFVDVTSMSELRHYEFDTHLPRGWKEIAIATKDERVVRHQCGDCRGIARETREQTY